MATTQYMLQGIYVNGILEDVIAKTGGDNVTVTLNGSSMSLTSALASILGKIAALPTQADVNSAVSAAIDDLIAGAPGTYDTLKEIADYIAQNETVVESLDNAIANKVDKVSGKGLSTEDFTTALKEKLESTETVTAAEKAAWDAKASTAIATTSSSGLMSADDKIRLNAVRGVRYGTSMPSDILTGELFIQQLS